MYKIVSLSRIEIPMRPFNDSYILAVVENDKGKRAFVQTNKKYGNKLKIGAKGNIKNKVIMGKVIKEFFPKIATFARLRYFSRLALNFMNGSR